MAVFLANIAFALTLMTVGFGFYLMYLCKKEGAGMLRWGGLILVIGGFLVMACTGYHRSQMNCQKGFGSGHGGGSRHCGRGGAGSEMCPYHKKGGAGKDCSTGKCDQGKRIGTDEAPGELELTDPDDN